MPRIEGPPPQDHRLAGNLAELLARVELLGQHLAAVTPVIAEVEHELELLTRPQTRADLRRRVINPALLADIDLREADPPTIR